MGTASRDLFIQTDVNRFAGDLILNQGNQDRLNPTFGAVTYGRSIGVANSNLAAFSVSKHFTRRWTAHGIYTWGKSLDYTSSNDNDNGNGGAENIFDAQHVSAQYGRANFDSRQRFSGREIPQFQAGSVFTLPDDPITRTGPRTIRKARHPSRAYFTCHNTRLREATYIHSNDHRIDTHVELSVFRYPRIIHEDL